MKNIKNGEKFIFIEKISTTIYKNENGKLIKIFSGSVTPVGGLNVEFLQPSKNKKSGLFKCIDEGYIYKISNNQISNKAKKVINQ